MLLSMVISGDRVFQMYSSSCIEELRKLYILGCCIVPVRHSSIVANSVSEENISLMSKFRIELW